VISKAPTSLFFRGEGATAIEIAKEIETNSSTSVPQLLSIASFYLMTENGDEAKRIAEAALKLDEKSAGAYIVIGMANRVNFDPANSAAAFAKALELDPESLAARRSLADMKRALGKSDEALVLYDELLAKDAEDFGARNGRILSLFATGKRTEAESELAKAIEANPSNVPLLAGAAYWYAANGDSTKAIDNAGKAIAADPRYIWSHIALARGLLAEGRFADAEQVLLKAKKYGNFPTLEYEIASTKIAGGFYREAVEELAKSFSVKDGILTTKLGRRIERSDKSFMEMLSAERTASILEPKTADTVQNADTLKSLLELKTLLAETTPDPTRVAEAADAFIKGTDKMRYHRQIFAANELLEKKVAVGKAIELSKAAVSSVDDGLSITQPAAPIMASELYPSRTAAINVDKYVLVPDVPKQTLSAIARGRIEEVAGWSLLQQGEYAAAVTRYRRAVSILPDKSVWWRSSYWRLGEALEAGGNAKEAVDSYVKSYTAGDPDADRYAVIESAYKKLNGNTDGLEALIGVNPKKPEEVKSDSAAAKQETASPETAIKKSEEVKPESLESAAKKAEDVKTEPVSPKPETANSEAAAKKVEEVKTDLLPVKLETVTSEPEKKLELNTSEIKEEPKPSPIPVEVKSKTSRSEPIVETKKPLFEPVIIEIKKPEITKPASESKTESSEDAPKKEAEKAPADNSMGRPRVVEGKEVRTEEVEKPCSLTVSQQTISLIGGGGSVGLIVTTDGDPRQIKAESTNPRDVEVVSDSEVTATTQQLLYLVRSLSTSTNSYKVTFSSPCGKKEIAVKIR
jgi:tetratricopeptide (TPR) repeat protein